MVQEMLTRSLCLAVALSLSAGCTLAVGTVSLDQSDRLDQYKSTTVEGDDPQRGSTAETQFGDLK